MLTNHQTDAVNWMDDPQTPKVNSQGDYTPVKITPILQR